MDNRLKWFYITRLWGIVGILILISILGGCIDKEKNLIAEFSDQNGSGNKHILVDNESKLDANSPVQNASKDNLTLEQHTSNTSKQNLIRLILRPNELYKTGKLPIMLKIVNPELNETVITVFRPEIGSEWDNQTRITHIVDHNWTQNFSLRPLGNTSYVMMFVQISQNDNIVKKAAWNITFDAPIGRPE